MPIFEYQCSNCNKKYDILHKSSEKADDIICPECHSKKHKKLVSAFSASISNGSDFGGCSDGSCSMPQFGGGCANGMCGMN